MKYNTKPFIKLRLIKEQKWLLAELNYIQNEFVRPTNLNEIEIRLYDRYIISILNELSEITFKILRLTPPQSNSKHV